MGNQNYSQITARKLATPCHEIISSKSNTCGFVATLLAQYL